MAVRPKTTTVGFDIGLRTVLAGTSSRRGFTKLDNVLLDPDSRGAIRAIWGLSKVNATVINSGAAVRTIIEALGNDGTVVRFVSSSDRIVRVSDGGTVTDVKTGLTNSGHVGMDVLNDKANFCNGTDDPFRATLVTSPVVADMGVDRPDVSGVTTSAAAGTGPIGTPKWYIAQIISEVEGALSEPIEHTAALTALSDVSLLSVPLGTGGKIAVYRTGQFGGQPFLHSYVSGTPSTTVTVVDSLPDRQLGDLPFLHGDPPLATFTDFLAHMDRMFAMSGDKLWWADLTEGESWWTDTTFGNVADVFIDDGDVGTALARDPDGILFFKRNHIYKLAGRTPDDFVVIELTSSDQKRRSLGCPSPAALAAIPGFGLVFYWNKGVYRYQGGSIKYLSGAIEDELRTIRRQDEALGVSVGFYPARRQIWVSVPLSSGANPTHTYIYEMDSEQWVGRVTKGFRGFSAIQTDAGSEEFWALSSSDEEGFVYKIEDGTTFAGTAISCEAELPVFFANRPSSLKHFIGVIPNFTPKASGDFDIEIEIDGMSALTQTYTVDQTKSGSGSHVRMVNIGLNGRRIVVRVKSAADQPAWSIDSLTYVWQDFEGAEYP